MSGGTGPGTGKCARRERHVTVTPRCALSPAIEHYPVAILVSPPDGKFALAHG